MTRGARWSLVLGLVASGCAFDASGVPTGTSDGTGGDSGSDTTSSSSTTVVPTVTTADSASASSDASADPTTVADTSTAGVTADDTSTTAVDTTDAMSSDEGTSESSGAVGPICGNGMIESPETCETGDFGDFVCSDLGGDFTGTPTCAGCQLDTEPCCWTTGVACVPVANDCCNGCGLDFVCD